MIFKLALLSAVVALAFSSPTADKDGDASLNKALGDTQLIKHIVCEPCKDQPTTDKINWLRACVKDIQPKIVEVHYAKTQHHKDDAESKSKCLTEAVKIAKEVAHLDWGLAIKAAVKCWVPISLQKYDKC